MKRSEMMEVLNDALLDQGFSSGTGPCNHVTVLEYILNKLEKAGMLPPVYYPYTCGCSMQGQCPTCSHKDYKMYNVWEPEDET